MEHTDEHGSFQKFSREEISHLLLSLLWAINQSTTHSGWLGGGLPRAGSPLPSVKLITEERVFRSVVRAQCQHLEA